MLRIDRHTISRGLAVVIFCLVLAYARTMAPIRRAAAKDSPVRMAAPSAAAPDFATGQAILAASTQSSESSDQAAESNQNPQPAPSADRISSDLASAVESAVQQETYQCSQVLGGAFGKFPFQSVCPNGVLVGFRIGLGKFMDNDIIQYLQPIYRTPAGEKFGKAFGIETDDYIQVKAPPGCAVSGVSIRGGGGLDALSVSFMKIDGAQLNPRIAYVSTRIGGPGGSDTHLGNDGTPVIGICGRSDTDGKWLGLGLVFLERTPAADPDHAK